MANHSSKVTTTQFLVLKGQWDCQDEIHTPDIGTSSTKNLGRVLRIWRYAFIFLRGSLCFTTKDGFLIREGSDINERPVWEWKGQRAGRAELERWNDLSKCNSVI